MALSTSSTTVGPGPLALRRHPVLPAPEGPVVLLILDGVGIGSKDEFDAVALARTPNLDRLGRSGLVASLRAHGTAVGLPSDADDGMETWRSIVQRVRTKRRTPCIQTP